MTDPTKETVWITIPEEASPALETPSKVTKKESYDKVKNKAFWGGGFVALVAFAALLFAPQQIAGLMQAQLFDGTFKVVPDNAEQQSGSLFDEAGEEAEIGTATDSESQNVVEAEAEAVTIQVDPVSEVSTEDTSGVTGGGDTTNNGADSANTTTEGTEVTGTTTSTTTTTTTTDTGTDTSTDTSTTTSSTGTTTSGAEATTDAEPIAVDTTDDAGAVTDEATAAEGAESDTANETVELDANAKLLQSLSKQLEDYKDKESRNEQMIQDLMQLLEDQAAGVHSAAGTTPGTNLSGNQTGTQGVGQFGYGTGTTGSGAGVYRYNTHTVAVSPHDILAQNKGVVQQASYQANVAYNDVQAYSNQSYNPVLAGVKGQPDTGPAEVFLFAFAIASLGVLLWGSMRAIRG